MYKLIVFLFLVSALDAKELITPIPLNPEYDHKKALLGKKLFFDTKLSSDNSLSCASCHLLDQGGDDNLRVSFGVNSQEGIRNSPTIFNSRYNTRQFWDGSALTLEEQVVGPIHNPLEMASNFEEVISKLKNDKYYKKEFSKLFKEGLTGPNITKALAEFEKTLTTPNARFDKYLRGDKSALTEEELKGYKLFKEYGCISCHNGINLGGNLMQKIGIVEKYDTVDFGQYNITKKEEDKFYFKVPGLRNVELTAPYFHDGKIKTLRAAVEEMMKYQVGFVLQEEETENIIKFLKTLTGDIPKLIEEEK